MGVEGSVIERFGQLLSSDEVYRLIDDTHMGNSSGTRIDAMTTLGHSGDPRAVRPLMECCDDKNPDIRKSAIRALCRLQSPRAVGTLVERMSDRDELMETRQQAARALAVIKGFHAIEGLKRVSVDENEDPAFRRYIKEILDHVEKK
jgi:HEAT repeat protein